MVIVIVILIENDSLQRYFCVFEIGCWTWSCFFKRTLNVGIGAVGLILVAYGCLGLLHSGSLFLGLSMLLRWERQKNTWNIITIFFNRLAWIDFDLDFVTFQGAWVLILTLITFQGAWGLRQLGFPDWQLQCHRKVRGCSQIYEYLFLVSWCGRCWYWCSFFFVI